MEFSFAHYGFLFLTSGLIVGLITPKIRQFALHKKIYDHPNASHKTHLEPVPYLGGISIITGVVIMCLSVTFFLNPKLLGLVFGILLPPVCLGVIGLTDDILNLNPWPRFISQTAAGALVAITLIRTDKIGRSTGLQALDIAIVVIAVVILSINFFDNIDGGASGSVAISTFFLAYISVVTSQQFIAFIAIVISGSTTGFLWWNKSPARIYMGDAGSLFLGSLLASLLVYFASATTTSSIHLCSLLFLVAVPLLDTSTVIASRLLRGVSPFKGARDHLSHRFMSIGLSKSLSVVLLWTLTSVFASLAIIVLSVSLKHGVKLVIIGSMIWLFLFFLFLRIRQTTVN